MAVEQLAVMPLSDYQDICVAIRTKTGSTAELKSGDIAQAINNIPSAGGDTLYAHLINATLTFTGFSIDIPIKLFFNSTSSEVFDDTELCEQVYSYTESFVDCPIIMLMPANSADFGMLVDLICDNGTGFPFDVTDIQGFIFNSIISIDRSSQAVTMNAIVVSNKEIANYDTVNCGTDVILSLVDDTVTQIN